MSATKSRSSQANRPRVSVRERRKAAHEPPPPQSPPAARHDHVAERGLADRDVEQQRHESGGDQRGRQPGRSWRCAQPGQGEQQRAEGGCRRVEDGQQGDQRPESEGAQDAGPPADRGQNQERGHAQGGPERLGHHDRRHLDQWGEDGHDGAGTQADGPSGQARPEQVGEQAGQPAEQHLDAEQRAERTVDPAAERGDHGRVERPAVQQELPGRPGDGRAEHQRTDRNGPGEVDGDVTAEDAALGGGEGRLCSQGQAEQAEQSDQDPGPGCRQRSAVVRLRPAPTGARSRSGDHHRRRG